MTGPVRSQVLVPTTNKSEKMNRDDRTTDRRQRCQSSHPRSLHCSAVSVTEDRGRCRAAVDWTCTAHQWGQTNRNKMSDCRLHEGREGRGEREGGNRWSMLLCNTVQGNVTEQREAPYGGVGGVVVVGGCSQGRSLAGGLDEGEALPLMGLADLDPG